MNVFSILYVSLRTIRFRFNLKIVSFILQMYEFYESESEMRTKKTQPRHTYKTIH